MGYEGESDIVTIPSEYDGCIVNKIDDQAFAYSETIQVVNIPDTIKYIEKNAFECCGKLSSVNFDKDCNIEVLSESAFEYCNNLVKVTYPTKGFVKIKSRAFLGCIKLKDCYISDRTEEIGAGAFKGTSITSLNFSNNIKSIGNSAFSDCKNITSVSIPASVKILGYNVFEDCSNLVSATIKSNTVSSDLFNRCTNLNYIILENGVEYIGRFAFSNTAINKIVIPYTVKEIGIGTFNSCENLTDVYVLSKNVEWEKENSWDKDPGKIFSSNSKVVLHGFVGSSTENCAKSHGIRFVSINSSKLNFIVSDANEVVLNWDRIEDVQKYIIYRANKENGDYKVIREMDSESSSYIDRTVETGKTYYYYIAIQKAFDNNLTATIQSNTVKANIAEADIKISEERITVNKIAELYLLLSKNVIMVDYEIDNPEIVSVKYGEWNGNKLAINLFGEKKGSTKITFSNNYSSDIAEVYVTVSQERVTLSKVEIGKWKKISKKNSTVVEYKIKWKSIKNASGYEVEESLFDDAYKEWYSSKQITKKTSWSYETSRLDTSKVKIKVRAYRYEGSKKVYGKWSKVETTKIKF